MGNYRQHVGFAGFLGVFYAWGAAVLFGLHWLYGSVAALLTTVSGLLPDLDSESSVQLRGFTGLLGILAALAIWQDLENSTLVLPFEARLWTAILAFLFVRHGLRRLLASLTVHRGMNHSLPTALIWGAITYLCYPSSYHLLRLLMAIAVMLGVLSHLVLDEVCSVDLRGRKIKKSFGTALKLGSKSVGATLFVYALLAFLLWQVSLIWPEHPLANGLPMPEARIEEGGALMTDDQ